MPEAWGHGDRFLRCPVLQLALLFCVALSGGVPHAADPTDDPMTEEQVVRMVLAGQSRASIVDEINRRTVRFDTSSEMLEELRLAGVPRPVITAMVARQRSQQSRDTVTEPADPAPATGPQLQIAINASESRAEEPSRLRIDRSVVPALAGQLQLPPADPPPKIDDVALFVDCRTAEHVPDHWRGVSPLGRDFVSLPRHRMLAFVAGAARSDDRLTLELPRTVEIELQHAAPHRLSIGVAIQIGDRFYRVTDDLLESPAGLPAAMTLLANVGAGRNGALDSIDVAWSTTAVVKLP